MTTAEIGDLIEFVHPCSGLCLWGVYVGEGHVIHFGVGGKKLKFDRLTRLHRDFSFEKKYTEHDLFTEISSLLYSSSLYFTTIQR